jgi:hypothetical protein
MEETASQAAPSTGPFATRDVLILGAGFSRAVSEGLPLVDDLGNFCLAKVDLRDDPRVPIEFKGGSFETWLSRLADEQPYLRVQAKLAARPGDSGRRSS